MTGWSSLLTGFDVYPLVFNADTASNMTTEVFTDRLPQTFYIGLLNNFVFNEFYFVFYALASSAFILTVMFALWFIIIDPFLRKIGILWKM